MISFVNSADNITAHQLAGGFFARWPNPPSPQTHLRMIQKSDYVWIAADDNTEKVVGFVTAISDSVLSAYIPLSEVLPTYQGRGVGQQLVTRTLDTLGGYYMIGVICDLSVQPFYEEVGMIRGVGMRSGISRGSPGNRQIDW